MTKREEREREDRGRKKKAVVGGRYDREEIRGQI